MEHIYIVIATHIETGTRSVVKDVYVNRDDAQKMADEFNNPTYTLEVFEADVK